MIMKICKSITAILLSMLTIVYFLPVPAFAAGSIDTEKSATLKVSYQNNDTPMVGIQFDAYLVANIDESGELEPTETFKDYNVDIRGKNDAAWKALASTLEGYIARDKITPTASVKTDEQGIATFENMDLGLYLIMGEKYKSGKYTYTCKSFMVQLPSMDKENNVWNYAVSTNSKHESSHDGGGGGSSTVSRKVLKVWKDTGYEEERPKEVTVQLLRDNEVYDTITLNADNNWEYTWSKLSNSYTWTVVEKELSDYTVTVTKEGTTFVVTNTYDESDTPDTPDEPGGPGDNPGGGSDDTPDTPSDEPTTSPDEPTTTPSDEPTTTPEEELPQTGQLWWPVPVLTASGLLLIVIGLLRRKGVGYGK